ALFDGPDMVAKACRCALDILDRSRQLAELQGPGAIRLGIGLHTGPAMIGNLGSAEHFDYTVVGKTVNLAARLCGIASQTILRSRAVRDGAAGAAGLAFRSERAASVRGFREPITIYDLERP